MIANLITLLLSLTSTESQLTNEKFRIAINWKADDIHIYNFNATNTATNWTNDSEFSDNTTSEYNVGEIDYSIRADVIVWREKGMFFETDLKKR
jgi:hypothetical protein